MIYAIVAIAASPGEARQGLGLVNGRLFHGCAVWATYGAARAYMQGAGHDLERMKVVGLDGDWVNDTWAYGDAPFRYTLRTLHVM